MVEFSWSVMSWTWTGPTRFHFTKPFRASASPFPQRTCRSNGPVSIARPPMNSQLKSHPQYKRGPGNEAVLHAVQRLAEVRKEISQVLVGQQGIVEGLLIGLLTGGH